MRGQRLPPSRALSLNPSGQVNGTPFSQTPTVAGDYAFEATYNGDPTNPTFTGSVGSCESFVVESPDLFITETADAFPVTVGSTIGFTTSVGDAGAAGVGTASDVTMTDPLPAGGLGVDWSISPAYAGPGTCSIAGAVGVQLLTCGFGNLTPGSSVSLHIASATDDASAGTYLNTATAGATNSSSVSATAIIVVTPSQAITFTSLPPGNAVVGGTSYDVSAAGGGSGNPVVFSINPSAEYVCGVSGSIVSFIGPGICTIDANQAGNTDYGAAAEVQQSFSVAPRRSACSPVLPWHLRPLDRHSQP